MKRWIWMLVAALVLVGGSVGGTLWLTKDDGGGKDAGDGSALKATSMQSWLDEIAASGLDPASPEAAWNLIKTQTCTTKDFSLYVTLSRGTGPTLSQERVGIKHACPQRLPDWDAAVQSLNDINDRTDYLCSAPLDELSMEAKEGEVSDQEEALIVCDQYQTPEWEKYYDQHFAP